MNLISTLFFLLIATLTFGQTLTTQQATQDLKTFHSILQKESSYLHLSNYDYQSDLKNLELLINTKPQISILELNHHLSKILYQIGDRHSRIKYEGLDTDTIAQAQLCFPFLLANHNGQLLALLKEKGKYRIYNEDYPYLKSINGLSCSEFIDKYLTKHSKAPLEAKLTRSAEDINDYGEVLYMNNEFNIKEVRVVLTDGQQDKTLTLPLGKYKGRYKSIANIKDRFEDFIDEEQYDSLSFWINDKIAYTAIPRMYAFDRTPEFEAHLKRTMKQFREAENLIIDIRYNKGGQRHIVDLLGTYILPKAQSPWVANIAYVRSDQYLNEDIASMDSRFLHSYHSPHFSEEDRRAIDAFHQHFKLQSAFDTLKFSQPYYMILRSGANSFKGKVYLLMNERCFSAASVFAAAFKGMSNVTLVGETTDGSSGRSAYFTLPHSSIELRVSTMLSFQRDGRTLDGNGTAPDWRISPDLEQILEREDTQLRKLIEGIEKR